MFRSETPADMVQTPTLQEQLMDRPADLLELTRFIVRRLLVELPDEADSLAWEAAQWVEQHFGSSYDWPGNIRELEQCVRNVMIRKSYAPPSRVAFQRPDVNARTDLRPTCHANATKFL